MLINEYLYRDFPLKLTILEESVDSLSKRSDTARKNWIAQLKSISERMKKNTEGKWTPLELPDEYKKRLGVQENDSYLFISPVDVLAP
ncbi:MAG: hypothetical protein LBC20_04630 [Planctomycetaceae bacterium]|jgi:hypothetical protein|nr:hypothetical protein [Planctomycetaceae bacterium]